MEKQQIYRDEAFETRTRTELENAREALQALLDSWNEVDICKCDDLFRLTQQPEKYYNEKVGETVELPVTKGKFQISRDAYLSILQVPTPNTIYVAARTARKQSFTGIPALWHISPDGKTVEMDEAEAQKYIDAKSIYISNEQQRIFVDNVVQFMRSSNYLHETLKELPGLSTLFSIPFTIVERNNQILSKVEISYPQLTEVLKVLK
jgi:hypothetical protein